VWSPAVTPQEAAWSGLGYDFIGRGAKDVDLWRRAIDTGGEVDWDELFGRYRSVTDWPTLYFWDGRAATAGNATSAARGVLPATWR
jgi:hypothetical protein